MTGNKEDNDNGMLISIGIGPAKGDRKHKDRGSSSRSGSYGSSSSHKSSVDSSCEEGVLSSHNNSGSNSRS